MSVGSRPTPVPLARRRERRYVYSVPFVVFDLRDSPTASARFGAFGWGLPCFCVPTSSASIFFFLVRVDRVYIRPSFCRANDSRFFLGRLQKPPSPSLLLVYPPSHSYPPMALPLAAALAARPTPGASRKTLTAAGRWLGDPSDATVYLIKNCCF